MVKKYNKLGVFAAGAVIFLGIILSISGGSVRKGSLVPESYAPAIKPRQEPGRAVYGLPAADQRLDISRAKSCPVLRGMKVDPYNPFDFNFIVDPGEEGDVGAGEMKRLAEYFLAALTIPEQDLWVNLSPYEEKRVVSDKLSFTEMGKDLLSQDYLLKQIASSLTYPECPLGRKYWGEVYQKVKQTYGTADMAVSTFNKVWIVPGRAEVASSGNTALVTAATLKVMHDADYVAMQRNHCKLPFDNTQGRQISNCKSETPETAERICSDIFKETVLPRIEREVNQGSNFAKLRQMYSAFILAAWFKQRLKDSVYSHYFNREKIAGIDLEDKHAKDKIYSLYTTAYEKGVYDYTKKDYDSAAGKYLRRRYCSGGINLPMSEVDLLQELSEKLAKALVLYAPQTVVKKVRTRAADLVPASKMKKDISAVYLIFETIDRIEKRVMLAGPSSVALDVFFQRLKRLANLLRNDDIAEKLFDRLREVEEDGVQSDDLTVILYSLSRVRFSAAEALIELVEKHNAIDWVKHIKQPIGKRGLNIVRNIKKLEEIDGLIDSLQDYLGDPGPKDIGHVNSMMDEIDNLVAGITNRKLRIFLEDTFNNAANMSDALSDAGGRTISLRRRLDMIKRDIIHGTMSNLVHNELGLVCRFLHRETSSLPQALPLQGEISPRIMRLDGDTLGRLLSAIAENKENLAGLGSRKETLDKWHDFAVLVRRGIIEDIYDEALREKLTHEVISLGDKLNKITTQNPSAESAAEKEKLKITMINVLEERVQKAVERLRDKLSKKENSRQQAQRYVRIPNIPQGPRVIDDDQVKKALADEQVKLTEAIGRGAAGDIEFKKISLTDVNGEWIGREKVGFLRRDMPDEAGGVYGYNLDCDDGNFYAVSASGLSGAETALADRLKLNPEEILAGFAAHEAYEGIIRRSERARRFDLTGDQVHTIAWDLMAYESLQETGRLPEALIFLRALAEEKVSENVDWLAEDRTDINGIVDRFLGSSQVAEEVDGAYGGVAFAGIDLAQEDDAGEVKIFWSKRTEEQFKNLTGLEIFSILDSREDAESFFSGY